MTEQVGDDDRKSRIITTKRTSGQITQGGWCGGTVHIHRVRLIVAKGTNFVIIRSQGEGPPAVYGHHVSMPIKGEIANRGCDAAGVEGVVVLPQWLKS